MLKGMWIELDQYQNLKLENSKDAITLAQFVEQSRIFNFLLGLNPEYDPIRAQMLGKEKLQLRLEQKSSLLSEVRRLVK